MSRTLLLRRRIKLLTWLMILGLALSGATAIPLETELNWLARLLGVNSTTWTPVSEGFDAWIHRIWIGLQETGTHYPFLAYGTDWLAFGHFVIAIGFIGALRDPVRNIWLFQFGMIACVLVLPYAIFFGGLRGIPIYWRFIDIAFGAFGFVPLGFAHYWTRELARSISGSQTTTTDLHFQS